MKKRLLPVLVSIAAMSFGCQKEKQDDKIPEPDKPIVLAKVATAAISSVQIFDDCPDPKPASPAVQQAPGAAAPEPPAKRRAPTSVAPSESRPASAERVADEYMPSDAPSLYAPPCQQTTVQIDFSGQGSESAKVVVKSLRLLSADGKSLATLSSRAPTQWSEEGYVAWDESLPADSDLKTSYKMTPPNWSEIETAIGGSSHGKMFTLEATIEIGGQEQVVRSSAFARYRPEAVPT